MFLKLIYNLGLTNLSKDQIERFSQLIRPKDPTKEKIDSFSVLIKPRITKEKNIQHPLVLKVVGVGGGGCNAIESMRAHGLSGVEYIAVNTDAQVLRSSTANLKVQIGDAITRGLGAGADPKIGRKSAEENRDKIVEVLLGSDMVFIITGMGGGTGTGAAPVIASIAKSLGALVVGIVTKPFKWEGKTRMMNAERGIHELRKHVDSLIVIPNERLLNILDKSTNAFAAFDKPNEVLYEATRGIADIITIKGLINVDFTDVRAVMNQSGESLLGFGIASGENRAVEAAQKAISGPLLEGVNIKGAKSIIVNVTGSSSMTMQEINEGNNVIFDAAGIETNVIFGVVKKEEMNNYISYTVIVTGFDIARSGGFNEIVTIEKQPTTLSDKTHSDFILLGPENIDANDLDVPTILKVSFPRTSIEDDEGKNTPSGFAVENSRYSWAIERNEKEDDSVADEEENKSTNIKVEKTVYYVRKKRKDKKDDSDDDDSSSFLRMIID